MVSSSKSILPFTRPHGFVVVAAKNHFSDASTGTERKALWDCSFPAVRQGHHDVHHSRSRLTGTLFCKHFSHQRMPNGTVVPSVLKRGGF